MSLSSNNPLDTSLAKATETATLTVRSEEPLHSLTLVKPDGSTKPLDPVGSAGTQWTLSKTIETGDNGPLEFRLQYTDLAGNSGEEVTTTTDDTSVTMDTVAPDLSGYALTVNGSSSFTAKLGDVL